MAWVASRISDATTVLDWMFWIAPHLWFEMHERGMRAEGVHGFRVRP
jgi:hypothetical protein